MKKFNPQKQPKKAVRCLTAWVDEDYAVMIDRHCFYSNMTRSRFIREALDYAIENMEPQESK